LVFYKGNRGQNEEIYKDLKNVTQTWFAGLAEIFEGDSTDMCARKMSIQIFLCFKPLFMQFFISDHHTPMVLGVDTKTLTI
jgi:hypothetical protein